MKILLCLLLFVSSFTQRLQAQNNSGGVAVAGLALITAGLLIESEIQRHRESFERGMVQWIMSNKNFEDKVEFDLDLIKWEITRKEEFNDVCIMGFKYLQNYKQKEIILAVCSPGWINEYGTNYSKIKIIEIDKNKWDLIFKAFLNLSQRNDIKTPFSLDSIPVISNNFLSEKVKKSIEKIQNIESINDNSINFLSGKFKFEPLGGNTHIVQDFDKDFMIDFNEGSMNLFIKGTKELIKIKKSFLEEANKIFYY